LTRNRFWHTISIHKERGTGSIYLKARAPRRARQGSALSIQAEGSTPGRAEPILISEEDQVSIFTQGNV